jgi:glycine hydroxymethyltransferase
MSNNDAFFSRSLADTDPEIFGAIEKELGRQRHEIELIASENIVSRAVLEAQGSIMTNKYAEGYPGKRYYGGCQYRRYRRNARDRTRQEAVRRQLRQRAAEFRRQMNQAVFLALLQPGDTFMGLDLELGRSPDPWLAGQHVRQVVQGRLLRRARRRPPARHG